MINSMKRLLHNVFNKISGNRYRLVKLVLAWISTLALYLLIFSYFVMSVSIERYMYINSNIELFPILVIGYFFINHLFISRHINHRILLVLDITLVLTISIVFWLNH